MEQRRQRDMDRARAAGARRLDQTAAIQQRVQAHIANREEAAQREQQQDQRRRLQEQEQSRFQAAAQPSSSASHTSGSSTAASSAPRPASAANQHVSLGRRPPALQPLSLAPGPVPARQWDDDFTATIRRSAASALSPQAAGASFAPEFDDEMDVARAIASRHALHDQFQPADRYQRRAPAYAASSSASSAAPHFSRSSAPAAAGGGSFSGRSTYDLAGVLRAREAQRDRLVAQQMAQQEREEAIEHAKQMQAAQAAMQPFEVTAEWRRRWAHASHTSQCGVCLDSFQLRALVTQLPCAHTFHSQTCLAPWLVRSSVCPMCRFDLKQMCPASRAIKPRGDDEPFEL